MSMPAVVLENTSASAQTNVPFTFGQVFKQGDLPAGSAVALIGPGGATLPCQVNVHNTHPDGSVRHASLSVVVPNMATSAAVSYTIERAASGPTGAAPVPADYPNLSASVTLRDHGLDPAGPVASPVTYVADLAPLLAAGSHKVWRSGPIMAEWVVRAPLKAGSTEHPDLHVRFHVLVYKGQQRARIHAVVEQTWAKPRKPQPTTGSAWETVSNTPKIYSYEVRVGGQVVDRRDLNGYHHVLMTFDSRGTYRPYATGIPNDSTVYTAAATIDGVRKNISLVGSAIQTYGQLFDAITAQLGGLGVCDSYKNGGLRITSNTTGSGSSVVIDYGTLLPALQKTGLSTTVTYTATVTINGTAKAISVLGSGAGSFARLAAAINAQLGTLGKAIPQEAAPGIRIVNAQGTTAGVTITDGTLFAKITSAVMKPRRPMRGDEYVHYGFTFWKKTFWWGTEPQTHIRHDKAYMIATHAWPNYQPDLTGDANKIAANLADMQANGDIGQNGITKAFMGDQGYAPGIGLLPEWTAMYIVNQGRDAKKTMLWQADLQGSWSAHAREFDTDLPVSFAKWPMVTWSPSAGDSENSATGLTERLPLTSVPSYLPVNANKADVAHHPDFAFVPYLVTGDLFYLECLLFYFTYVGLSYNAAGSYRAGGKVLFFREQTRAQGWAFRTTGHTLYALPDDHPRKAEIAQILANNLAWYNANYVDEAGPQRNAFGHFNGLIYSRNGESRNSNASFQEEFVTQSVGRLVEMGNSEWLPLLRYRSEHVRGRLTSGADFCYQLATSYTLQYRDTETSPMYTTWAEVYNKGFSADITSKQCGTAEMSAAIGLVTPGAMSGYPAEISGYPANMQPAVAYCATYQMPGCDDAWLVFDARPLKPDYNKGPQFAIVPRTLSAVEVPELPPLELLRAGPAGLGGAVSGTASGIAIFDDVQPSEASAGRREYRCEYVRNNSTKTLQDAILWTSANTPSAGTNIRVGLGTSGINGTEQTVADEITAPTGVTFKQADTKATGLALGDIPPGGRVAVWYERDILPNTGAAQADGFTRTVEGSI